MTSNDIINPPPQFVAPFHAAIGIAVGILLVSGLLFVSSKFDPTHGPLTISLLIVVGMLGATAYCLIFTIPNDDITPGVVGGLTAGFGAVIAYWLGHRANGSGTGKPPPPDGT